MNKYALELLGEPSDLPPPSTIPKFNLDIGIDPSAVEEDSYSHTVIHTNADGKLVSISEIDEEGLDVGLEGYQTPLTPIEESTSAGCMGYALMTPMHKPLGGVIGKELDQENNTLYISLFGYAEYEMEFLVHYLIQASEEDTIVINLGNNYLDAMDLATISDAMSLSAAKIQLNIMELGHIQSLLMVMEADIVEVVLPCRISTFSSFQMSSLIGITTAVDGLREYYKEITTLLITAGLLTESERDLLLHEDSPVIIPPERFKK